MFSKNKNVVLGHNPFAKKTVISNFDNPCDAMIDPVKKAACEKTHDQQIMYSVQGGSKLNSLVKNNEAVLTTGSSSALNLVGGVMNMHTQNRTGGLIGAQPVPEQPQGGMTPEQIAQLQRDAYNKALADAAAQNSGGTTPQEDTTPKGDPAPTPKTEEEKQKQFFLFGGIGVGVLVLLVVVLMVTGKKK